MRIVGQVVQIWQQFEIILPSFRPLLLVNQIQILHFHVYKVLYVT